MCQYRCVNRNSIDLFQWFCMALINVCKVIRGQWMKGTIEALIATTGRIIAFYHYQVLMLPLSPLSPFTDGNGSIPSEVSTSGWSLSVPWSTSPSLSSLPIFSPRVCEVQRRERSLWHILGQLASLLLTCLTNSWSRKHVIFHLLSRVKGEFG